ncbi:MAG TPA: DUF222 domain-containing protein, partial [Jatrophihabitantaceae bacterium]|nr:DUF222 domain-containing protein [Jatrophihabitantaceae bacterium]
MGVVRSETVGLDSYDHFMISQSATAAPAQQGVELLAAGVDALLDADLCALSPTELIEAVQRLEVVKRRLAAVDHALIAELESRNVAGEFARRSTADLLVEALRIDAREATGRVRAAAELGPRRGLSGESLPPIFAAVAAAQAEG